MLKSSAMERDLGTLFNYKLNMSQQCPGGQEGQPCPGGIRQSISSLLSEGIVLLCSALVQIHLEYCEQFWSLQYKKDIKLLGSIQRRARKKMKDLERKPYEELLRSLGLFSLENRGHLIAIYNFLVRGRGEADTDLFSVVTSARTQGNGLKLRQERFRLDIRKRFFT
ncbi:hypothetical protein BTVI_29593 [Pitangus sulphuratus]|nr:hypothetical protein BTVI_29593 [Pitangus sulphuratus]